MTRATMKTFTLPSFSSPGFRRMKMTRATTSTMVVVAAAVAVTSLGLALVVQRSGKAGAFFYRDRFEATPQVSK